jgi:hypothetical protein
MIALDAYLRQAFEGFHKDPADTPFQCGYLAALLDVAKNFHPDLYLIWKALQDKA